MGELIAGTWHQSGVSAVLSEGVLRRPPSIFRNWIGPDDRGAHGARAFGAEADRYHLYVSLACPWAHRTIIMRNLKGLAGLVGMSVVHWHMGDDGWTFEPGPNVVPDAVNGAAHPLRPRLFGHFKCNRRPIVGYPSLWRYTKELYRHPDIRPTVNFQHIKAHYYGSHRWINPSGIVPAGPDLDLDGTTGPEPSYGER